jgi:hypothetical protein
MLRVDQNPQQPDDALPFCLGKASGRTSENPFCLCHFRASRAPRPPLNHFFENGVRDMNEFGDLAQ